MLITWIIWGVVVAAAVIPLVCAPVTTGGYSREEPQEPQQAQEMPFDELVQIEALLKENPRRRF